MNPASGRSEEQDVSRKQHPDWHTQPRDSDTCPASSWTPQQEMLPLLRSQPKECWILDTPGMGSTT